MRLGGSARFMATVTTPDEVAELYRNARRQQLPIFILGGGSNVIARDEGYSGIILLNRITGFDILSDEGASVTIKLGAGEIWDDVVKKTVEMGLVGIEAMSAIPGTVGAAPVQNVGAYGQEVADTFVSLEAYDSQTDQIVTLSAADCHFSYRHSIFRGEAKGRYCITSVTLRLFRAMPSPPFYAALQRYLDDNAITTFTPDIIRQAVMAIRADKLPNPVERPNTGSFFKNAIVEQAQFDELSEKFPDMPHYDMPDGRKKIPTGWLIEQTGLKGALLGGMRVHEKNALVLINESAEKYADLAAARQRIIEAVRAQFGITIEQEPLELV